MLNQPHSYWGAQLGAFMALAALTIWAASVHVIAGYFKECFKIPALPYRIITIWLVAAYLPLLTSTTVAVVGLADFLAALTAAVVHFAKRLEKEIRSRGQVYTLTILCLSGPQNWDKIYVNWLHYTLRKLQVCLGGLYSGRESLNGIGVCCAISMSYTALFFVIGWMFGGPGSVGSTAFLPTLDRSVQLGWGSGLLTALGVVGLALLYGRRIDGWIESRLVRRLGRPQTLKWLYRIIGATVAASLWGGTALNLPLDGGLLEHPGVALGLGIAATAAVSGALAGDVVGAALVAFAVAEGAFVGGLGGGAIAAAFAVAVAIAREPIVVGTGLSVAFAVALAFVAGGVVGGAIAIFSAVLGAFTIAWKDIGTGTLAGGVGGGAAVAGAVAVTLLNRGTADPFAVALPLFFVVLPFLNAVLDWISWWISRFLGEHLLRELRSPSISWLRSLWRLLVFFVHILIDLLIALLLLVLLAALLPFVVQLFNEIAERFGERPPLELSKFLENAEYEPVPNGVWALAMLLSTLIPTALHAGAVILGIIIWLISPGRWRQQLLSGLRAKETAFDSAARFASWLIIGMLPFTLFSIITLSFLIVLFIGTIEPVRTILVSSASFGIAVAEEILSAGGPVNVAPTN